MPTIFVGRTLADVYLVHHVLSAAGIAATIRNEHLVGTDGGLPVAPELWPGVDVADVDVRIAQAILDDHRRDTEIADALSAIASEDVGDDHLDGQDLLTNVFVAAQALSRNPRRGGRLDDLMDLYPRIAAHPSPFGIDPAAWTRLGLDIQRVVEAAAAGDDDRVQAAAEAVRSLVAPLVGGEEP